MVIGAKGEGSTELSKLEDCAEVRHDSASWRMRVFLYVEQARNSRNLLKLPQYLKRKTGLQRLKFVVTCH